MRKEKGQDIIEYALMLAVVVGIGFGIYSYGGQGIANSISSVFNNAGSLLDSASLPAASSPEDIMKRLVDGRYQKLADMLQGKPKTGTDIPWNSAAGQELARKLNIQMKDGDGWYARIISNGQFVVSYYSADLNNGMTISQLQSDYKDHPDKYAVDDNTGQYKTTVKIYDGVYSSLGAGNFNYGKNDQGVAGHIEPGPEPNPDGSRSMIIYPGSVPIEKPKDHK